MANDELEPQSEFRLPRVEVRMPQPATWKLTADELKRYEDSKLIISNEEDADVKLRRKVDSEHAAEVKAAHVDALAGIILNKPSKPSSLSVLTAMREKRVAVYQKEEELLENGVLATEISHAPDKMYSVFRGGKKGTNSFIMKTGSGDEEPARTLRISRRGVSRSNSEGLSEEDNSLTFTLTQKQGPWVGEVEVNIPFSWGAGTKADPQPDSANSRVIEASGVLKSINFVDASRLIIDTVNAAAGDFENAVHEVDSVFKDAESRHLNKKGKASDAG